MQPRASIVRFYVTDGETSEVMADEPWVLAKALFDPCYIGGMNRSYCRQLLSPSIIRAENAKLKRLIAEQSLLLVIPTATR